MLHEMNLHNAPFQMIKAGYKIYELRLNDEKRQTLKINDEIVFTDLTTQEILYVKIVDILYFKSFAELYSALPATEIGYFHGEEANYQDMLMYYSSEKQRKYGAIAIKISIL